MAQTPRSGGSVYEHPVGEADAPSLFLLRWGIRGSFERHEFLT